MDFLLFAVTYMFFLIVATLGIYLVKDIFSEE